MGSSVNVAASVQERRQGNSHFILSGGVDFLLIIAWHHLWGHKFSQIKATILLFFNLQKYHLKKMFVSYKI
jgi:hypothetical protein